MKKAKSIVLILVLLCAIIVLKDFDAYHILPLQKEIFIPGSRIYGYAFDSQTSVFQRSSPVLLHYI